MAQMPTFRRLGRGKKGFLTALLVSSLMLGIERQESLSLSSRSRVGMAIQKIRAKPRDGLGLTDLQQEIPFSATGRSQI